MKRHPGREYFNTGPPFFSRKSLVFVRTGKPDFLLSQKGCEPCKKVSMCGSEISKRVREKFFSITRRLFFGADFARIRKVHSSSGASADC